MADFDQIEIPEGFVLDTPVAPPIPEGFELDKPEELPEDIELFGQALSESDASRFLADLRGEKIDITRGVEEPILTPSGVVLKGPEDIRRERARKAEDGWAEVVGRSVIQGGLIVPATIGAGSRFLNELLGLDFRGVGPEWLQDIPDLYDLKKEADDFWKPSVGKNEAKRHIGQIVRTMTEMGTAGLLTGGFGMLPALSVSSGLQKFAEEEFEDASFWKKAYAGVTQTAIEYSTEKLPIGVLLKSGLSLSRRLILGLITDVPGEMLATAGEMALVDTAIHGKRYTFDQYISAEKETFILAVGVTGGMTVAVHPMIQEIEEFEKEVKGDPETFEAQFQQKLNEMAGIKEEAPTPEQLEETKQADIETAKKTFTDLGMDDATATEEATKIAEQVAKAREVFHQEEIREDPVETITADISGQLQATGRISKEDADLQAEALYGTFFVSMAKRVGADPIDLFESYNVSIGRERAQIPDAEGITFDQTGEIVTETPAFKAWFGESKVVDEQGEPLTVFHGTPAGGFEQFERFPAYFSSKEEIAEIYQSTSASSITPVKQKGKAETIPAYLSLQRPFDTRLPEVREIFENQFSEQGGENWVDLYMTGLSDRGLPDWTNANELYEFIQEEGLDFDGLILDEGGIQGFIGGEVLDRGISYVAFEPTQIKSVFAQKFDPTDPRILFQEEVPAPVFFSQLERVAEEKIPDKIPAQDAFNILKKNTKAEELKWFGVEDFLAGKKTVTKDELVEFLRANEITVTETQRKEGAEKLLIERQPEGEFFVIDTSDVVIESFETEEEAQAFIREEGEGVAPTKFEDQVLPGGEDYTELVLTLPVEKDIGQRRVIQNERGSYNIIDAAGRIVGANLSKETADSLSQIGGEEVIEREAFTGGHFDEPNVLAHIRFNTRTDSEGNKVLFLEEIQSDWAAKGRKEGFKRDDLKVAGREALEEAGFEIKEKNGLFTASKEGTVSAPQREVNVLATVVLDDDTFVGKGIPSAPLLKNWHELALKRMLRYAAENNFDKLAWITGEQTADRYDLSKVIDEITYRRTAVGNFELDALKDGGTIIRKGNQTHSDLESLVGKDITNKIEAGEGTDLGEGLMLLKNVDLKVGGAWAKTLYDKVIPNFLKKYGKKWGVKVEEVDLEFDKIIIVEPITIHEQTDGRWNVVRTSESGNVTVLGRNLTNIQDARAIQEELQEVQGQPQPQTQQSIAITDEMKASVLAGQPLFQKKKGRIEFGPEGVKIDLLRDADPSTLLHETGHFYLKVLGDLAQTELADQELIDDAQIVADWVGAPDLSVLTRDQSEKFARGFEAYLREGKAPSSALRKAFAQFKEWLTEVYQRLRNLNVQLTPEVRGVMDRMLASQEEIEAVQTEIDEATIDLVAEGRDLNKITQVEIKKHLTPAARRTVKGLILETVGKRPAHKFIREDKALSASWKKAEQSARQAFKAGKLEEAAKWKEKMKVVIAKANAKVEVIQTEKQKMAKRRRTLSVIKNFLNLTDAQMKGLTKKRNVANMTDWEFKQFKDDLLIRAEQVQETALAKARVMEIIERKQLQKVGNYQKSLGLPTISKMSKKQLDEFVTLLEVFEDADVFLNTRELETVDRTDLRGIRTWREAKERLAKETGASIEDLTAIKVNWTDKFKWDNSLAESNPFYELMVTEMNKKLLQAEARVHEVENEVFRLAKASEKSRGRSISRKLIPQDKQIMAYLEASEEVKPSIAKEMTPEQLDLAHFMGQYFNSALEYLIKTKSLDKGRENYFVHIRRSFLETLKDDGLGTAVMSVFKDYQEQEMVFNILDGDTGNILPLEKFFQFSLRRTGALTPTQNIVKAFLAYSRTFEKKVTLDEAIPKLDIYAQSLTPKKLTSRGLELDRSLKKFVYQYVNNKKGRQIDLGFVKQGDKIDLSIRALRTFTTLLDLGASIPVGAASFIGEQVANFTMLGEKGIILGTVRGKTKKGKAILEKYEAFVGRSAWEEFTQPGKEIGERVIEGMFGLFHQATTTANKLFLLASLSKSEYDSGTISDERLARLRIEMGRFRAIPGAKSLVGSTSPGGAAIQYKSWAVPILRTIPKDLATLATDLKNKPTGEALTTREARELFRVIRLSFIAVVVLGFGDREDKTFVGQLSYKARREVLTVLQALSPDMWLSTPRLVGFVTQLGKNLKSIIMLEEYKTKPGLKGVGGIKRQFTPSVVRQLTPDEERRQRR